MKVNLLKLINSKLIVKISSINVLIFVTLLTRKKLFRQSWALIVSTETTAVAATFAPTQYVLARRVGRSVKMKKRARLTPEKLSSLAKATESKSSSTNASLPASNKTRFICDTRAAARSKKATRNGKFQLDFPTAELKFSSSTTNSQ